ncbi:MAG: radical SAM protein [Candidatus Methanoperedens sp.]|nr:radical SAM protein [Candidatus Methanoperedens sp.]CAG0987470.1 hypothetical protein METP1_02111 [Methanosarcinales archaeon]
MGPREVVIFCSMEEDHWEPTLIRGALWHHGIRSRVLGYKSLEKVDENALCIVLSTHKKKEAALICPGDLAKPIVLAGHDITQEYIMKRFAVSEDEIVVYGEPYALLPKLAMDQDFLSQMRGKAVLGPLLDTREYSTYPAIEKNEFVSIMTSMGCMKRCGYCTYGRTFSGLYSKKFSRRSRPWKSVQKELIDFMGKGINVFALLADQFLSADPEENQELYALASNWDVKKYGRPMLTFTISPLEVLGNRSLLKAMSMLFQIYPRYSIDSFDPDTLALLDLDFDASQALEALEFLTHLRLSFRINYIFIRPGMTLRRIEKELNHFKSIAAATSYMTPYEKLLLAFDLFSHDLQAMRGTSVWEEKRVHEGYEAWLQPEILRVMSKIQEAMRGEMGHLQTTNKRDEPLHAIIDAGLVEIKS